jgi:hypothetical protein
MPPSTSLPGTVVGVDVVVEGGGGRVLLDVGSVGMVVVASVVLAPVEAIDGGVETGAVDVGATAGNDALGAHPAATNKATTSAFDLTVPPTTEATVVRWGRRSGATPSG